MGTHRWWKGPAGRRALALVASLSLLLALAPAGRVVAHEDPCPAQLRIEKTAAKDPINRGEEARFIVTVTNVSTNGCVAKNVTIEDNYDVRLDWSTNRPMSCRLVTGQHGEPAINCNVGDLAAGASWSVEFFASTPADWDCSAIVNRAKVRWANDPRNRGLFPDADTSLIVDQASASIRVQGCEVPEKKPDVEVKKTAFHEVVESGDEARFDIQVVNRGPGTALNVVLVDTLPNSGLVSSFGTTPRPECSISGNWVGHMPTQSMQSVFGPNALPGTILDGLNFGGGPKVDGAKQILLRHAVAALLNSTQGAEFQFGLTTSQVISQVTAALATNNRARSWRWPTCWTP